MNKKLKHLLDFSKKLFSKNSLCSHFHVYCGSSRWCKEYHVKRAKQQQHGTDDYHMKMAFTVPLVHVQKNKNNNKNM